MNILGKIGGLLTGGLVGEIGGVLDKFHFSWEEKTAATLEIEKVMQRKSAEVEETIRAELDARTSIIAAEMASGDNYTRRARPTVVYTGLGVIVLKYVLFPLVTGITGAAIPDIALPGEFWAAWSGVVGIWMIGRSVEKRGTKIRGAENVLEKIMGK